MFNIFMMLPATFVRFMVILIIQTPHYTIEYRKHFTNIHVTVVGLFGATESLMIMEAFNLVSFFSSRSNDIHLQPCK